VRKVKRTGPTKRISKGLIPEAKANRSTPATPKAMMPARVICCWLRQYPSAEAVAITVSRGRIAQLGVLPHGKKIREKAGATEDKAEQLLKKRMREKRRETFILPQEQRITVAELLDARQTDLTNRSAKSDSSRSHMAVLRQHFGFDRAV